MRYLITVSMFILLATPVLAVDRPEMVRPRFWEQTPLPVPPPPPPFPDPPIDPVDPPIDDPIQTITNSTDCIQCSGGGEEVATYPPRLGQFWAKRGSLILPLYNFGKYVRYRFFEAIDDGTGGQWFSKGTFKLIN